MIRLTATKEENSFPIALVASRIILSNRLDAMSPGTNQSAFISSLQSRSKKRRQSKLKRVPKSNSNAMSGNGGSSHKRAGWLVASSDNDNGYHSTSSHSTKVGTKLKLKKGAERRTRKSTGNGTGTANMNTNMNTNTNAALNNKSDNALTACPYEVLTMDTTACDDNGKKGLSNTKDGITRSNDVRSFFGNNATNDTTHDNPNAGDGDGDGEANRSVPKDPTNPIEKCQGSNTSNKVEISNADSTSTRNALTIDNPKQPEEAATASASAPITTASAVEAEHDPELFQQAISTTTTTSALALHLESLIQAQCKKDNEALTTQIQTLQQDHHTQIQTLQQDHQNKIQTYNNTNTQLSNQATSLYRQIASLQNNLEIAREAYEEEKRRHKLHWKEWNAFRKNIGKQLMLASSAEMESQRVSFDSGLDLLGDGVAADVNDNEENDDMEPGDTNSNDNNTNRDGNRKEDQDESGVDHGCDNQVIQQEQIEKNRGGTQDSEETIDTGGEVRSPALIGPLQSKQGINSFTEEETSTPAHAQSPVLLSRPVLSNEKQGQSDDRACSTSTSNIINFTTGNEYRSSKKDNNAEIAFSPKILDYSSALPIKQDPDGSPSQEIDQFSIQIDDDSSDDDETKIHASQRDCDDHDASPLKRFSKPHVTPATDDFKIINRQKNKIPIRDVSNQKLDYTYTVQKTGQVEKEKQKRASPSSWLDTDSGKNTVEGNFKKSKHRDYSSTMRTCRQDRRTFTAASSRISPRSEPFPNPKAIQPKAKEFKYKEVVRGKSRDCLDHKYDCTCCNGYYDALLEGKGAECFDRESLMRHSRHRSRFSPDNTPDGFWEMSFADSIAERRAKNDEEKVCQSQMLSQVQEQEYRQEFSQSQDQRHSQGELQDIAGIEQSIAY